MGLRWPVGHHLGGPGLAGLTAVLRAVEALGMPSAMPPAKPTAPAGSANPTPSAEGAGHEAWPSQ